MGADTAEVATSLTKSGKCCTIAAILVALWIGGSARCRFRSVCCTAEVAGSQSNIGRVLHNRGKLGAAVARRERVILSSRVSEV
jgi:hypothetical protein